MEKSKYHFRFEDLKIYQKALDYDDFVNDQVSTFPKIERYRLSSQFIRASDSIALNIAEGYSGSKANFLRYLGIALGSLDECVVCSTKAFRRNIIDSAVNEENRKRLSELSKMIQSYMNYLRKGIKNDK